MRRMLTAAVLAAAVNVALASTLFAQESIFNEAGGPATTQPAAPAPGAAQAQVPVKQVVLYSSGVGYFEHFGKVAGDGSTELRFKTEQINDILKSLVLQDLDGGKVSVITYPSQDPVAKTLKSFQVNITDNPPLRDLLNQLRGAEVTVQQQGKPRSGTILGVETREKSVGDKDKTVEEHVLNLKTGPQIISIVLESVDTIELKDSELQAELDKALGALSQARDQDKKPVRIGFAGQGDRRVRVGYVVETPVWKTSYRLLLANKDEKPRLQGWAIVENQTDNDWDHVQLSLVSGRPISFIQDLYQPLYVSRPVVVPELYASLKPRTYDAGMDAAKTPEAFGLNKTGAGSVAMDATLTPSAAAPAPMAQRQQLKKAQQQMQQSAQALRSTSGAESDDWSGKLNAGTSIASVASAAKIGELFEYTVGNVSLPRQKSAMLPIVTDEVEVEKLSIYNQSVLPKNPLNGARLKNTTKKHLLQGPITVLDGSTYAGDAQIDNLPPGQERLLSYGIDLQMRVDATKNKSESALMTGKIVKGVLELTRKNVFTQDYLADNKSEDEKTLIIEHPIRQSWKLVDTEKPIETTETLYRFKGKIAAGKSSKLAVTEQIVQDEQIAILPCDIGQLVMYSKRGEIPQKVRDALVEAIGFKQKQVDTQREIDRKKAELAEITQEQTRIRENMKTVQQNGPYYGRLMKKLDDQETKIESLQTDVETLTNTLKQQQKDLEDYLSNMNVS
jgi:hypothetical protein